MCLSIFEHILSGSIMEFIQLIEQRKFFLEEEISLMILATSGQHSYNTRTNILKISGQAFL